MYELCFNPPTHRSTEMFRYQYYNVLSPSRVCSIASKAFYMIKEYQILWGKNYLSKECCHLVMKVQSNEIKTTEANSAPK